MTESIRVGIIGTSWWADEAHLPMLKADPRVELAAICGRNRERAQEMATKYEVPGVFTDYRDMISRGNLQAVVIATPDDEHYAMTMDALDAGLHVVCEKPLALRADHAKAMYEKGRSERRETHDIFHLALDAALPLRTRTHRARHTGTSLRLSLQFLNGVRAQPPVSVAV